MSRLDDILARNRKNAAFSERNLTSLVLGAFLLVIIALAAFTNLGRPADAPAPVTDERVAPAPDGTQRLDGVLLGRPRAHPGSAQPAARSTDLRNSAPAGMR